MSQESPDGTHKKRHCKSFYSFILKIKNTLKHTRYVDIEQIKVLLLLTTHIFSYFSMMMPPSGDEPTLFRFRQSMTKQQKETILKMINHLKRGAKKLHFFPVNSLYIKIRYIGV